MPKIAKAFAISDAKISFVSLVDKAANKKQFLITKAENGAANFTSFGRILKSDAEKHFVTGVVYEPMVEDTQGNYMTEDEIVKAAHWFMKNQGSVDLQHCFKKTEGVEVVESYVTKCDMEIEGEEIKKGTWLMTAEITDAGIWESIQKGDITGFSMGGYGVYSEEDVELGSIEKDSNPKGLLKRLAKAFGMDIVEKGQVKDNFKYRVKEDNFYSAWYALKNTLERQTYNPNTGSLIWDYESDENTIKEALADFNDIVSQILTSDMSIVKSLEKAASEAPSEIMKAGKSLSSKNLQALQGINDSLSEFLSGFEESDSSNKVTEDIEKEDKDMTHAEVQQIVSEEVKKAMEPITTQMESIVKGDEIDSASDITPAGGESATNSITAESVSQMVGEEVAKAVTPIMEQLEGIMKSRALPANLNGDVGNGVRKSEEPHYMTGMF